MSEFRVGVFDQFREIATVDGASLAAPVVVSETTATGYSAAALVDPDLTTIWRSDAAVTNKELIFDLINLTGGFNRDFIALIDPYISDAPGLFGAKNVASLTVYNGAAPAGPWTLIATVSQTELYGALVHGRVVIAKYPAREVPVHDRYLRLLWTVTGAVQVGASKIVLDEALTGDEIGYPAESPAVDYIDRSIRAATESGAMRTYHRQMARAVTISWEYANSLDMLLPLNRQTFSGDNDYLMIFLDWSNERSALGQHELTIPARIDGNIQYRFNDDHSATVRLSNSYAVRFVEWL